MDLSVLQWDFLSVEAAEREEIKVMLKATKIIRDKEKGSWAVQVFHKESGRYYWLDVSYDDEYKEIHVDWNQYIFYNTDEDDMERKAFQENCDNFDAADSEVYWILLREGEIKETNVDRGGLEIAVEEWKAKSWEVK